MKKHTLGIDNLEFSKKYCFEFLIVIGTLGFSLCKIFKSSTDPWTLLDYFILLFAVLIAVASVGRIIWLEYRNKHDIQHRTKIGLDVMMRVLYNHISKNFVTNKQIGLRSTIHVPTGDGKKLVQLTNYSGNRPAADGGAGRKFDYNVGIVGAANTSRKVNVASRVSNDSDGYVTELTDKWSFSKEEARKINPGSKSWMAVPIKNSKDKVVALLYLDATIENFFDSDDVQSLIAICIEAIVESLDPELHIDKDS